MKAATMAISTSCCAMWGWGWFAWGERGGVQWVGVEPGIGNRGRGGATHECGDGLAEAGDEIWVFGRAL